MPRIRPYAPGDWEDFIRLDLETGAASIPAASEDVLARFRSQWPESVRSKYCWTDNGPTAMGSRLFVLEGDDGQYAGHLWLTEQDDFFSGERKLFVTTVAVDSRFRGRGWGRLLMMHACQLAREGHFSRLGLGVAAANTGAIRLYESLGFQTVRLSMEAELPK